MLEPFFWHDPADLLAVRFTPDGALPRRRAHTPGAASSLATCADPMAATSLDSIRTCLEGTSRRVATCAPTACRT